MRNKFTEFPFMLKFFLLAGLIVAGSYTRQSLTIADSSSENSLLQKQPTHNDSTATTPLPAPEPVFKSKNQAQSVNYSE
ncbi:MAG: hypothetical protein H7Y04_00875 [Verrucomicrobia bacterium]|nr:hypothetical protein [Cytophagales bacterium]